MILTQFEEEFTGLGLGNESPVDCTPSAHKFVNFPTQNHQKYEENRLKSHPDTSKFSRRLRRRGLKGGSQF